MFPGEGKEDSLQYIVTVAGISAVVLFLCSLIIFYIIVCFKSKF